MYDRNPLLLQPLRDTIKSRQDYNRQTLEMETRVGCSLPRFFLSFTNLISLSFHYAFN